MQSHQRLAAALAAVVALMPASAARADVVIFKDGFTLQGKVKQPGQVEVDPGSGQPYWMPRGFFIVDDGVRRIYFSPAQVQGTAAGASAAPGGEERLQRLTGRTAHPGMSPLVQILWVSPWKYDKWERTLRMNTAAGAVDVKQRLTLLTPHLARADATNRTWGSMFVTSEFGPEVLRHLLETHPDLKLRGDAGDATRRMRVFRFFTQAGYYAEAEAELNQIVKDFPAQKYKAEEARTGLQKLRAAALSEDIRRAHDAGRHEAARKLLAAFPDGNADAKVLADVRALRSAYEDGDKALATARRLLQTLPAEAETAHQSFFKEAATAIDEELTFEAVGRLEPFITQGEQAERDRHKGRKPENSPGQLLALAVTGWLQGRDAADPKFEAAQRIWKARTFALEYLRAKDQVRRTRLLRQYQADAPHAIAPDEMAQLLPLLPPADPVAAAAEGPIALQTEPSALSKKGVEYLVQLPPEYNLARPCPVLFALAMGAEEPKEMIDRLARAAGEHGYILVAPRWGQPMEDLYQYSAAEHAAVLDVLRELRRHLAVDSDRVFLLGLGQGGNMAYDVGLAHPDLFAGVIPIGGKPDKFVMRYTSNCQELPLYIVDGAMTITNQKWLRPLLAEKWIPRGYPVIYVEYKGRGIEWFDGEVPHIFDWMNHKRDRFKRATAVPVLGRRTEEYITARACDNRFYWLAADAIAERHLVADGEWSPNVLGATLQARIKEGNLVQVEVHGLKKLTIWLTRDMLDFAKPATVRVNNSIRLQARPLSPSLETLMQDVAERGDRQRPYWVKVTIDRP